MTATCLTEEALLSLIKGRASPSEREQALAHLEGCQSCRAVAGALARLSLGTSTPSVSAAAPSTGAAIAPRERYVLLDVVGAGAMGVVCTAYDQQLQRRVALKLLSASERKGADETLVREAQVMAKLSHPNVVHVFDTGRLDDRLFIAMEYLEGGTLAGWLTSPRPWRAVVKVFEQAGRGLAAAHAVGVVHRDFKPENVLLAVDGSAHVGDFGLAHAPAIGSSGEAQLVGTIAYMAPEVMRGEPASPSSDQFSFCVALFEALTGARPFPGSSLAELKASIDARRTSEAASKLPGRVRRLVLRGLERDPARRFGSMGELVRKLTQARTFSWVRVASIATPLLVAAALLLTKAWEARQAQRCSGAEDKLASVWSPARAARIESAFVATKRPFAIDAARGVKEVLDRYGAGWVRARREACEATRVHGLESEATLELRTACLDRRLLEIDALGNLLEQADEALVTRAAGATGELSTVESCADTTFLENPSRPPPATAPKADLDALQRELAQTRALWSAGKGKEGVVAARAALERAKRLKARAAEAEALWLLGSLLDRIREVDEAERRLTESTIAAEASRSDLVLASARITLLGVIGSTRGDVVRALALVPSIESALERIDAAPSLRGRFENNLGNLALRTGDYPEAIRRYGEAARLFQVGNEGASPRHGIALNNLAVAYDKQGDYAASEKIHRQALAVWTQAFGPKHPFVVMSTNNLGRAERGVGQPRQGLETHRKALALQLELSGDDDEIVASIQSNIADCLHALGEFPEALVAREQALRVATTVLGPDDSELFEFHAGMGHELVTLSRFEDARPQLERALALRKGVDSDPTELARARFDLAQVRWAQGPSGRTEALALANTAHEALAKAGPLRDEEAQEIARWLAAHR